MPSIKINAKWNVDLNARTKTIKLSEENMSVNLNVLGLSKATLEDTTAQMTKDIYKIDKLVFKI